MILTHISHVNHKIFLTYWMIHERAFPSNKKWSARLTNDIYWSIIAVTFTFASGFANFLAPVTMVTKHEYTNSSDSLSPKHVKFSWSLRTDRSLYDNRERQKARSRHCLSHLKPSKHKQRCIIHTRQFNGRPSGETELHNYHNSCSPNIQFNTIPPCLSQTGEKTVAKVEEWRESTWHES